MNFLWGWSAVSESDETKEVVGMWTEDVEDTNPSFTMMEEKLMLIGAVTNVFLRQQDMDAPEV